MISKTDILVIALGYAAGIAVGLARGLKSGKERFWKMPGASWKVKK